MNTLGLRAIAYIVIAVFSFTVLDATAKYLAKSYPTPMVVWARYAAHCLVLLIFFAPKLGFKLIQTSRPKVQVLRGLSLVFSSLFFFSALKYMPLADAQCVALLAPILVTFAANRWLNEPLPKQTWWVLAVSFIGVLLVVKPGTSVFSPASFLALGAAVCFAAYQLMTRMVAQVDNNLSTLFISGLVGTVVSSLLLPWVWEVPHSWTDFGLFIVLGLIGAGGHLIMFKAYELAPASRLAPYIYLQIVGGLLWGYLLFNNFPDGWALIDMCLIAAIGILNAILGRR